MKIKHRFISNSSSTSFVIYTCKDILTEDEIERINDLYGCSVKEFGHYYQIFLGEYEQERILKYLNIDNSKLIFQEIY